MTGRVLVQAHQPVVQRGASSTTRRHRGERPRPRLGDVPDRRGQRQQHRHHATRCAVASSHRCLDAAGGATDPGTAIEIWDCNGGANQEVTLTAAGELRLYGGTQCLDAYNNQTTAGTKVELWDCNGQTNQQRKLNPDGSITGVQSGLCLDVTGGDKPAGNVNGIGLELWTCNGGANQQWSLN